MRVVLTIGLTGLALLQSGSCGANVQNKYLGQLLPGPGCSSITILPASRQAASPSSVVSCILYPGSFDGSTHDSSASDVVGLYQLLIELLTFADGAQFNLFSDLGYHLGHSMITPFRTRCNMTREEAEWNWRMSRRRVVVESSGVKIDFF